MVLPGTVLTLASGTVMFALAGRLAFLAYAPRTAPAATDPSDVPGVIALPPFIFLAFLVAAAVLEAAVPLALPAVDGPVRYLCGIALGAAGVVLMSAGSRRLSAAGTNIPPTLPTTALVVGGIYRHT